MQTVLITGVSDGIGRALAAWYAARGARVLGIGRRPFPASLDGVLQMDDYCRVDLAWAPSAMLVRAFLDARAAPLLDVLVHNAALGWYGPVASQSATSIDELLQANLWAPIALTHALLPRLAATNGVAAFVSSVHSALPAPDFAVYTATKAALDGFARNLRVETRGQVSVLVVWPGPTATSLHVRSGVPAERINQGRAMAPEVVAAFVGRAIVRRRSGAVGGANRLLRWLGTHFEATVDSAIAPATARARVVTGRNR